MKKKVLVLLLGVMVMAFCVSNAGAVIPSTPQGWWNVNVTSVGVVAGVGFNYALCTSTEGAWTGSVSFMFNSADTHAKETLAALLTAYSSGGTAAIFAPGPAPVAGAWVNGTYASVGAYPF